MKQLYPLGQFKSIALNDLRKLGAVLNHPKSVEIERRISIITFFDKHGPQTTKEAFGVSRSTVYAWKRNLALNGGRLVGLAPGSKSPLNKRKRLIHPAICSFIIKYRAEHPRVGQTTIKPHLDAYCRLNRIGIISTATIGRVISDLKRAGKLFDNPASVSLNASNGSITGGRFKKKAKKLRRKGYAPQAPGDLVQVDSVSIFMEGLKRYIVTAIDLKTRFAFACAYGSLSSLSARDFMEKFRRAAPFDIKRVQTDNGQEFAKYFRDYAAQSNITQFFNYPRNPKSNAFIERFNRTIQEKYVDWHKNELIEPAVFNCGLMKYLIWYNTEKPHQGINGATPMQYFLDGLGLNPQKSSMLRYSTQP